jgi:hypothetical protein
MQMSDLTEQWKKGELPEGDYYISNGDEIYPDYYDRAEGFLKTYDYGVRRVIAEVPDYVEWRAKLEENAQLKELLKECKQWFDWYHIDTGTGKEYIESWHKKGHEIHKRLNEVLK